MRFSSLQTKLLVPIVLGGAIVTIGSVLLLFYVNSRNIETTGLNTAQALANQVTTLRRIYSNEVAMRAEKAGLELNYDFMTKDKTLPLPATMVNFLGESIATDFPGSKIRLYSRYPFPHRAATEKYDAFEERALSALERDPKTPIYQLETINGRLSMRYAVADIMRQSCVNCHNNNPESPKRDWKVGDVRGAIEIIVPVDKAEEELRAGTINLAMLITIGLMVIIAILILISRRVIIKPINSALTVAEKIAEGDLTTRIGASSKDEMGKLLEAMRVMVGKLSQVIGEVRSGANSLSTASSQISSSAQSLSQGTSQQAAAVEETSSSLEEMNASVSQNAENSRRMEEMAVKGAQDADEGARAVKEMVEIINRIAEKISIVEEIAYQTNMLALNAAIEAARAGEHGKGFAVVATEVRKLAEYSQKSAKEIGTLATNSVKVTERASALLFALVPSIGKTADLVQEVAAASHEQSAGINQINRAMAQVDQVTQLNASAAEELASTAEEMAAQADKLRRLIAFFRIEGMEENSPRPDGGIPLPVVVASTVRPAPRPLAGLHKAAKPPNGGFNAETLSDHDFKRF